MCLGGKNQYHIYIANWGVGRCVSLGRLVYIELGAGEAVLGCGAASRQLSVRG